MDNDDNRLFDQRKAADLKKILECIPDNIGRKPGRWEQYIFDMLCDSRANNLNVRFIVDEDKILLVPETDDQPGMVELTDDYACVFKAEPVYASSLRDMADKFSDASQKIYPGILVCGARPVASLLSVSLPEPANDLSAAETGTAIESIASYGNVFGIPVTGGDVHFVDAKRRDMKADMMVVGLLDKNAQLSPGCSGEGNSVWWITDVSDHQNKPESKAFAVRTLYELVGDLHDERIIVSAELAGRGGILRSCVKMTVSGSDGMELLADALIEHIEDFQHLSKNVSDGIILIVKAEDDKKLERACRKWNKLSKKIGIVSGERKLSVTYRGESIVDLPAEVLAKFFEPDSEIDIQMPHAECHASPALQIPQPEDYKDAIEFMMTRSDLLSQRRVFNRFDSTIGTDNMGTNFISDASVMQIKGSGHALAFSFCQNTFDLLKYPEAVGLTVAESVRKVICSGGEPRLLTGCLNCGGAMDEDTEKRLHAINEYVALACKKMGIGSSGITVKHTGKPGNPTIDGLSLGTVAFLEDKHQHMTMSFKGKGDMIYMLGKSSDNLDSSEYIRSYLRVGNTPPPCINMDEEINMMRAAQRIIARKLVKSAHGISRGGLFPALLESAMIRGFGFDITLDDEIRKDAFLFGESPSRMVVSVAPAREADFIDFMIETRVPFLMLGHITREEIRIDDISYGFISDYKKKYTAGE